MKKLLQLCKTGGSDAAAQVPQLVQEGAKVDGLCKLTELTPLCTAAANGHDDVVLALLNAGAKVNLKTSENGMSALHYATQKGHKSTVELLLTTPCRWGARSPVGSNWSLRTPFAKTGADANAMDYENQSVLLFAAACGRKEIAEVLIAAGARVDARDQKQNTPLLMASEYGHDDVVELLAQHGADVNAKDGANLNTPLHRAASSRLGRRLTPATRGKRRRFIWCRIALLLSPPSC